MYMFQNRLYIQSLVPVLSLRKDYIAKTGCYTGESFFFLVLYKGNNLGLSGELRWGVIKSNYAVDKDSVTSMHCSGPAGLCLHSFLCFEKYRFKVLSSRF